MVSVFGGILATLVALLVGLIAIAFIWDYYVEREAGEAARKASKRSAGLVAGGGSMAVGAIVPWAEIIWQLPEIAIALFGLASLIAGFSVEVYLAGTLVIYLFAEVVNGGPRSA